MLELFEPRYWLLESAYAVSNVTIDWQRLMLGAGVQEWE